MANSEIEPDLRAASAPARWIMPFVVVATLLLSYRLLHLIDLHAVNLMFFDQFDFFQAFKGDSNAWSVFRWQHGPHRQGITFLGTWLIAGLTDWNVRIDAFYVGALIILATALALLLRRRLCGALGPTDVAISLLLLTPAQYGLFVHTPNASHSAGPLVLLILYGFAWTLQRANARYVSIAVINFLAVHTGFGFFIGLLSPPLLAIAALRDVRQGGLSAAAVPLACIVASILSLLLFLVGYTSRGGTEFVSLPSPALVFLYLKYIFLMFANVLGLKGTGSLPIFAGELIFAAASVVCLEQLWVLLRSQSQQSASSATSFPTSSIAPAFVILSLIGFSLVYCTATAVGRIELGLQGAQSTRYVPLVAPALLGLYLRLQLLEHVSVRTPALIFSAIIMLAATFPMRESDAHYMERLSNRKRFWIEAYFKTNSVAEATHQSRLHLQFSQEQRERLDHDIAYLREHRLNFFADR